MNIKFAFAVGNSGTFEAKHFGDADKYLIYEWDGQNFYLSTELLNNFKNFDEQQHGSVKKGEAIIQFLQKNQVKVLVSKQFGKNIQLVNRFFLPVLVNDESPAEAIAKLKSNIKSIENEISQNRENYKVFNLRTETY